MNNIIIIAYMLMVICLFIYANSPLLQNKYKIKITTKNILAVCVGVLFSFIIGGKIIVLGQSSSLIELELIAPNHMTPSGIEAIERVLASPDIRTSLDNCIVTRTCPSAVDSTNSGIITTSHDLLFASENQEVTAKWLRTNSISVGETLSWRGRYLHHYNTVLYPSREVLDGNFKALFNSQYGLASLLPALFAKDIPFVVYSLTGLISLMLFGLLVIFIYWHSIEDTAISGAIFILIALTCDVGALRFSPGFSFFRYFPVLILLYIFNKHLDNQKTRYAALTAIMALFNSLQLNLLVLLISLTLFFTISIREKINIKLL